jgi:hypothetical protein
VKLTRIPFTGDNKVNRQIFSAMVTSLDDNIGRILAAIDERVFLSALQRVLLLIIGQDEDDIRFIATGNNRGLPGTQRANNQQNGSDHP